MTVLTMVCGKGWVKCIVSRLIKWLVEDSLCVYRVNRPKYHCAKSQDIEKKKLKLLKLLLKIVVRLLSFLLLSTWCVYFIILLYNIIFCQLCSLMFVLCCQFSWLYLWEVFGNFSWNGYQVCYIVILDSMFHGERDDILFTISSQQFPWVNSKFLLSICLHLLDDEHNESIEVDVTDISNLLFSSD